MPDVIDSFTEKYAWLSNFWPAEVTVEYALLCYSAPTVEHAFQAFKAVHLRDFKAILACETPGQAKRMGRSIEIRPDWNEIRVARMELLLRRKFSHPDLRAKLVATGDAVLAEGNSWHDTFWGRCNCPRHAGMGANANALGRLLMRIRDAGNST